MHHEKNGPFVPACGRQVGVRIFRKKIEMFFVYVLVSEVDSSTYVGFTSNLDERLKAHNSGKTKSIKHKLPMKLVYFEEYETKELASPTDYFKMLNLG